MSESPIDYLAVFESLPVPLLLLRPDFTMIAANEAYCRISGRSRQELTGQGVLDAFPDNPSEPAASGPQNLGDSLRRVLDTGKPDVMALQRYDVESPGNEGHFEERYWCPVNVPVMAADGSVGLIVHCVEEVSDLIRKFVEAQAASA